MSTRLDYHGGTALGLFSPGSSDLVAIFKRHGWSVRDITWIDNSRFLFMADRIHSTRSTLFSVSLGGSLNPLRAVSGIMNIRGVSTRMESVGYVVRSDRPTRFDILTLKDHVVTEVAVSQTRLPSVRAQHLLLPNTPSPLQALLWSPSNNPVAAVVRFHGRGADELPVWQPDIQYFVSKNVAYLSIGYDLDKYADIAYQAAVLGAVSHFLMSKHVAESHAVLLGFSAGASFILHALTHTSFHYYGSVLVGLNKSLDVPSARIQTGTHLVIVQGSQDTTGTITQADFNRGFSQSDQLVSLVDSHLFVHPSSWRSIQELLDHELSDAVRAPASP